MKFQPMQAAILSIVTMLLMVGSALYVRAADTVRLTLLASGTGAWEIDTIKTHGLDAKHGIDIATTEVAGKEAADLALLGGATDVIVTDWIWVNRQRAAGHKLTFIPYSRQVGALLVAANSPIRGLADLKGRRIGVAGGSLDKSWILIQALARKRYGVDLAKDAQPAFGAPPLLSAKFKSGELDALLTFWQFSARLEAAGAHPIASVADVANELGMDANVPLLGFVCEDAWAAAHPAALSGLAGASRDAKALLATSDAEWLRLKPLIKPSSDAELAHLRSSFVAGIPDEKPVDEAAASRLLSALGAIGGKDLVGDGTVLQPGTFAKIP